MFSDARSILIENPTLVIVVAIDEVQTTNKLNELYDSHQEACSEAKRLTPPGPGVSREAQNRDFLW